MAGKAKLEYSVHVKTHSLLIDLTKCLPARKVIINQPMCRKVNQFLSSKLSGAFLWGHPTDLKNLSSEHLYLTGLSNAIEG